MSKKCLKIICIAILSLFIFIGCQKTIEPSDADNPAADAEVTTTAPAVTEASASPAPIEDEMEYKYVAFTFDDGPHNEYTKKVVDKLAEYGARATFFVVGNRVTEKSAEIVKYTVEHGNEIGMHSYTHTQMFNTCDDKTYEQEVKYTKNVLASYAGVSATLLRPPGGLISAERISSSQYPIIMWSVDSEDWMHKKNETEAQASENIQTIVDNVLSTIDEGYIVLMHYIYENTYLAFCTIIDELYKDGYKIVTVSELLGDSIKSGAKFHSVTLN